MIYKTATSNDFNFCRRANSEDCVVPQNKVNYLIKSALRLSMGTTNSMQFWDHKTMLLTRITLDINVVSKESRSSSTISLNIVKTNLHPLSLAFIV